MLLNSACICVSVFFFLIQPIYWDALWGLCEYVFQNSVVLWCWIKVTMFWTLLGEKPEDKLRDAVLGVRVSFLF